MAASSDPVRRPVLMVGLPESGLINPLLVLAGELARRGVNDLLFATDEPRRAEVEALTSASKVEFVSLGEVLPELSALTWDDRTYRAVTQRSPLRALRALLKNSFDPTLRIPKYRALREAVAEHRPAVMVIDAMCDFAVNLAITEKIPYVLSVPFLASNVVSATVPFGRTYTPRDFPTPRSGLPYPMTPAQQLRNRLFRLCTLLTFVEPSMSRRMRSESRIRRELGISRLAHRPMARFEHAERVLCYSVAEIDYPFRIPDKMHLVGAMVPPLPQAPEERELTSWLDAQTSVVYQGFGTITRLSRAEVATLVEVARRLSPDHQVLWKLPAEQQHLLPPRETLPPTLRIENWLPSQLDVLAHPNVRVFFNHAGSNAFHESLYFGKPQVLRPLWMDCHDEATRARDIGVGLALDHPERLDLADVTDKLLRVLGDPSFRERTEHLAGLQRAAGGRVAAADVVLDLPVLAGSRRG
ncbi:glycosyltransferase [Actinophytocola xanthii]|uniref:MGT family glycosyltransferase n=1 Tax=Actinophytocola xanthii TaxID=1912961 RepID=A0A1Q8BWF7_9PSEU|nr:glycosyltransferase [Actinophytocola xanthii]OLF06429.1 MGT family glycosyltransferase [Actinophytocola xanthii]